jgi:NTE family protein
VGYLAPRADIIVLPPLCPLSVSPVDFRAGTELIDRAHDTTAAWLDDGHHLLPHPERFLSMHSHRWASVFHEQHEAGAR